MHETSKCGSCKYFLGAGDYNLCCEKHSWLCYRDSEACALYEYSKERVLSLEEYDKQVAEYFRTQFKQA